MWRTGLVAPWHVGSSQSRARTRVPCIGRQILNHCATREAPSSSLESLKSLRILALGPQAMQHSCISKSRNILLPFFHNDQIQDTQIGIHNATPYRSALSFSSPPWPVTGMLLLSSKQNAAVGRATLIHGPLFVILTTDLDHVTPPFFIWSISSNFHGHKFRIDGTEFAFIVHSSEFLAASGWERDVQLHPEAAVHLQGAMKKS